MIQRVVQTKHPETGHPQICVDRLFGRGVTDGPGSGLTDTKLDVGFAPKWINRHKSGAEVAPRVRHPGPGR